LRPVRFGLVGLGWIGSRYLASSRAMTEAILASVADEDAERLPSDPSLATFSSYQEMAEHADLDFVVICTPPVSHLDITRHFLERGVAVLCEKPFAMSVGQAQEMCELARARSLPIAMATKYRCLEEVAHARSLVREGAIGDVVSFEVSFSNSRDMRGSWHSDPAVSGGGVFVDAGAHAIDVISYVFGPIRDILATAGAPIQGLPVEDNARALVRLADGTVGEIFTSWNGDWGYDYYVIAQGTTGALRVGWSQSGYRSVVTSGWQTFGEPYGIERALRRQLANFASVMSGHESPVATAEEAVVNVRVLSAASESFHTGSWVVLPTPPRPAAALVER
jgi:predicted dehydrogenase